MSKFRLGRATFSFLFDFKMDIILRMLFCAANAFEVKSCLYLPRQGTHKPVYVPNALVALD